MFFRFPSRSENLFTYEVKFIYQCILPRPIPVAFGQVPLSVVSNYIKWKVLMRMLWMQQLLVAVVLGA